MPVHSRVTSRTRLAPALLAILAILTILDDYQGWRFLLLGLGGAWLLSRWWARSLADQLSLRREMRFGWAQVGDRLEQRFTLGQPGPRAGALGGARRPFGFTGRRGKPGDGGRKPQLQ